MAFLAKRLNNSFEMFTHHQPSIDTSVLLDSFARFCVGLKRAICL